MRSHLHVLVEKVEKSPICLLISSLDVRVFQVSTGSHKAVLLLWVPLNNVLDLHSFGPLLNVLLALALRWEHGVWNCDAWSVAGIHHGRMARSRGLERGALLGGKVDNLATPAEANDTPFLDAGVLALNLLEDVRDAADSLWRCRSGLEELAELLPLLLGVRWVPKKRGV